MESIKELAMLKDAFSLSSLPKVWFSLNRGPADWTSAPFLGDDEVVAMEGDPLGVMNSEREKAGEGKTAKDDPEGAGEREEAPGE